MFRAPEKYKVPFRDINKEILDVKGEIPDAKARILLAQFMRNNIDFTLNLLTGSRGSQGLQLEAFQEIMLKGMLNANFVLNVWGRGIGKTWSAAVYCILQLIFEPGSKIVIAGPTFRTARNIFGEMERIVNAKGSVLLRQCFPKDPSKRSDLWEWECNGGIVRAIPLNGEKIRGFRANILVIDEFLLVPENLVKDVLMPFLASPQNLGEIIAVRRSEDELIKRGKMTESERMKFKNTSKLIGLSSASYTFENLYRTYQDWIKKIEMSEEEQIATMKREGLYQEGMDLPRYMVSQLSYDSVPLHMMDPLVVMEAKSKGAQDPSFMREYGAQFSDGSDSYFSAKKMMECTVPSNQYPTVQIFPRKGSKYLISIDPSFSDSESSDNFSMNVMLLDDEEEIPTLVHNYVVAGGQLKDHYAYFHFLYTSFRPELVIIDNAGWEFINGACQSNLFQKDGIEIKFIDFDSMLEGKEYEEMLVKAKQQYNKQNHAVAIKQWFGGEFPRKSNEHLKGLIDCHKIRFASSVSNHDTEYDAVIKRLESEGLPFKLSDSPANKEFNDIADYVDFQDEQIFKTKKECAIVELKISNQGNYSFRLPVNLAKDKTKGRTRKDSYTTLLLGAWGNKCYYDMMRQVATPIENTFSFTLV